MKDYEWFVSPNTHLDNEASKNSQRDYGDGESIDSYPEDLPDKPKIENHRTIKVVDELFEQLIDECVKDFERHEEFIHEKEAKGYGYEFDASWLDEFKYNFDGLSPSRVRRRIRDNLHDGTEEQKDEEYQKLLNEFINKIFAKVEQNALDGLDPARHLETLPEDFAGNRIKNSLFYENESLFEDLSLDDLLKYCSVVESTPELSSFEGSVSGTLNHKLATLTDEEFARVSDVLISAEPDKRITNIRIVESAIINLFVDGSTQEDFEKIFSLLKRFETDSDSALVKIAARACVEKIDKRLNRDFGGRIDYYNFHSSFQSENLYSTKGEYSHDDDLLEFNREFTDIRIRNIASNAVAAYKDGIPQYYAVVDPVLLTQDYQRFNNSKRLDMSRLKESLSEYKLDFKYENTVAVEFWPLYQINNVLESTMHFDLDRRAEMCAEHVGFFSKEQWKALFEELSIENKNSEEWHAKEGYGKVSPDFLRSDEQKMRFRILYKNPDRLFNKLDVLVSQIEGQIPSRAKVELRPYRKIQEDVNIPNYFFTKHGNTGDAVRYLQSGVIKETVEKDFGIVLTNISLESQLNFLNYLCHASEKEYKQLESAISGIEDQNLRNEVLETFLSCAESDDNAEYIIKLIKQIEDLEVLRDVFNTYNSIVKTISDLQRLLGNSIEVANEEYKEVIDRVGKQVVRRANQFLQAAAHNSEYSIELVKQLQSVDEDVLVLGIALKDMQRKGLLSIKDIDGLSLVTKKASELSKKEMEDLLELQFKTRSLDSTSESKMQLLQSLQEDLEEQIRNGSLVTFKVLYHENKPLGFLHIRAEEGDAHTVWIGGLNMHPSGQGTPLTEAIINEVRQEYFAKYNCKLEVLDDRKDLQRYYGSLGFKVIPNAESKFGGATYLTMEHLADEKGKALGVNG